MALRRRGTNAGYLTNKANRNQRTQRAGTLRLTGQNNDGLIWGTQNNYISNTKHIQEETSDTTHHTISS